MAANVFIGGILVSPLSSANANLFTADQTIPNVIIQVPTEQPSGGITGQGWFLNTNSGEIQFYIYDQTGATQTALTIGTGSSNKPKLVETANNTLDDGIDGNMVLGMGISPGNSAFTAQVNIFSGTGSPQGSVTGNAKDIYFEANLAGSGVGTHIWICSGTTNWTALTAASL